MDTTDSNRKNCLYLPKSREKLMQGIDRVRAATVYPHDICSDECRKRGEYGRYVTLTACGGYHAYSGFSGQLDYVDCCPNEPEPGKAFCHRGWYHTNECCRLSRLVPCFSITKKL